MTRRIGSIIAPCAPQRVQLLTLGGAKGRGSRTMFWELAPGTTRETCQCTVSQNHECLEKKEVQDGKGLKEALDSILTRSKSNAVERMHTECIFSNFSQTRVRLERTLPTKWVFSFAMTLVDRIRGWEDEEIWVSPSSLHICGFTQKKL